jgi:hypothetical protein
VQAETHLHQKNNIYVKRQLKIKVGVTRKQPASNEEQKEETKTKSNIQEMPAQKVSRNTIAGGQILSKCIITHDFLEDLETLEDYQALDLEDLTDFFSNVTKGKLKRQS